MSVVVAIKKNDRIYMGADTQTSAGDRQKNFLGEGSRKIHLLDNGILLGLVGSKKGSELLATCPEIFELPESGEFDKQYVTEHIVPRVHERLAENDLLDKSEDEPVRWMCSFVLAYKDKLFWIPDAGIVTRLEHFVAIGAGDDLAYAGLEALDREEITDESAIYDRLEACLRVSADYRCSVSAPFYLIDSVRKEYKLVK